ncbi:cathepsin C [Penaeus vannamei]|uniref:Dipeptidyl peptidase 1 n=1 Tax=Penaeus vannamei TaxID=6689 RepID=A0A3R7PQ19_PENVA|nr:cathepsin C [Penaeus vannamei]
MLKAFLLLACVAGAWSDTPANCLYEDIRGTWTFQETERSGDSSLSCDALGPVVHTKTFTLSFPDTATDELGNEGTWTLIYNQGFEININERSYFAFSYYEGNWLEVTSFCDRTFNGWSRDRTVRNWSCFSAQKNTKSYVSPVRDQGGCGSCYAFASMANLEAQVRIATRNQRQDVFSPQDVVSCSVLAQGCMGGFDYLIAGRYAMDQGVVAEECNPYDGSDSQCDTDATCAKTYVSEYVHVGGYYGACNEELMLQALVETGPISVSFEVYDDFRNYNGGIYHHTGLKNDFNPFEITNHVVLVVGYGADEATGEKYWIVKNSWGAHWGEDGYFRIRRGTDECSLESMAVQVTIIP